MTLTSNSSWSSKNYFSFNRIWHRCGESCSTGSSLPIECDPPYAPPSSNVATTAPAGTDETTRRSDSVEAARGGRASMSSQTSQQLAAKPTPSSLATIASRLAPAETSSASASNVGDAKNEKKPANHQAKQLPMARVCSIQLPLYYLVAKLMKRQLTALGHSV